MELLEKDNPPQARKIIFPHKTDIGSAYTSEGSYGHQIDCWFHPPCNLMLRRMGRNNPERGGENIHAFSGIEENEDQIAGNSQGRDIRFLAINSPDGIRSQPGSIVFIWANIGPDE
jgi:hypothetical protein